MGIDVIGVITAVLLVILTGVFPVFSQIRADRNPSPWVIQPIVEKEMTYQTEEMQKVSTDVLSVVEEETATLSNMDVNIPDFYASEDTVISIPDDEIWANVEKLCQMEYQKNVLSEEEYNIIVSRFGQEVADLITAVPGVVSSGEQVMIGTIFKENDEFFMEFNGDSVRVTGEIPKFVEGEIVIVKGSFIDDDTFFVQHWEDPEMVNGGYVSLDEWQQQTAAM